MHQASDYQDEPAHLEHPLRLLAYHPGMATVSARVAVVTVTYNSAHDILGFLQSASTGSDVLVVADNPSSQSDQTVSIAASAGAQVVRMSSNVGYGAAVNAAIRVLDASFDVVLISNPDVRLEQSAVARLTESLLSHSDVGAVGPRVLNADGTIYPSARQVPSLRTGVGHAVFSRVWPGNPWTRTYRQEGLDSELRRDVGWLSGACLMVRRSAFEQIGGFDERYFMYFEDVDLGYRLGKAGWRNVFEPAAQVTHVGGVSTASVRPQMLVAHHRSANRFLASKYPLPILAPLRWVLHVGLATRARWLTRGMKSQPSSDDK